MTPTLIRYTIAVEEESNRVLRKFSANLPYFIRLTFVTEEICQGYYHSSKPEKNNFILGYIYHIVKDGFKLGGNCDMKFLAYSNSQLKSHSAWFLCERAPWINTEIDASQIAQFMGDFSKEHNILKKHARKGQCFSTSTFVCQLEKEQVLIGLEDVKRNGFCFSDGVGYISTEMATACARKLGHT